MCQIKWNLLKQFNNISIMLRLYHTYFSKSNSFTKFSHQRFPLEVVDNDLVIFTISKTEFLVKLNEFCFNFNDWFSIT